MKKILFFTVLTVSQFFAFSQRINQSINSSWLFTLDNHPESSFIVNIPHTWNNKDAFQDGINYYRGIGSYEKKILIPQDWQGKNVYIKFEGANQTANLFVNNQLIGTHNGGYTGFVFDITKHLQFGKDNSLKIECDNRHNPGVPPLDADFNFYGGVYRDVNLIVTNPVHFELENEATGNMIIRTPEVSVEKALIKIETKLVNNSGLDKNCKIEVRIYRPDGELESILIKKIKLISSSHYTTIFEHQIKYPKLWSPEQPALYRIEATLLEGKSEEPIDLITTTFGCRWFKMDPEKGFFLNGKHYKLIGVNRHQDFEGLGNALPNSLHQQDYQLIKKMGANFVRISHYPHDPEAYRLCDELGLLAWSEIPIVNEITDNEEFTDNCIHMQREQILQFFNHPSVIMWGYMNEIFIRMVFNKNLSESDRQTISENTVELARKLDKETKTIDSDRLTVMALHNNEIYNETGIADIPDVIGWNLYFGWYEEGLDNLGKFLDRQHKKYPNRSLIISEYGPGADIRIQTDDPKPWDYSESYQLKSHQSYFKQFMERPYIAGMAAWNFADFGSSGRQDARPYINQKGLLNYNRTSKDIYHYYQALLIKDPFVYIAGTNHKTRYCESDESGKAKVKIIVFSNQDSAGIIVNDSLSLNAKVVEHTAIFDLQLAEGEHDITAKAKTAVDHQKIKVYMRSKLLEKLEKKPLLINLGTHCDYRDPITNEVWVRDQKYQNGSWGYIGGHDYQQAKNKFQGTPINILGTDNDPLFQTMRENIEAYKFDVDKGYYRVTLLFAEPNLNASENLIYNLSEQANIDTSDIRVFSVKLNKQTILNENNLAREYGKARAVEISYNFSTDRGILIEFEKLAGNPILSGIRLEKIN